MFTPDQMKTTKKFAEGKPLQAGTYIFVVKKVIDQVASMGFNEGKRVFTLVCEAKESNAKALFQDVRVPVYNKDGDNSDFVKDVRALAFWAETLGVAPASPPRPPEGTPKNEVGKFWDARDEWAIGVTNALIENPSALEGAFFTGEVTVNDAGYPKLAKKHKLVG